MFQRTTLARLSIGLVLGLVLAVVLHQSNTRDPSLYANLLSQGAFGAPMTASAVADVAVTSCMRPGCVPMSGDTCYVPDGTACTCAGGTTGQCGAGSCVNCNYSSSASVYCCYGAGNPSNCALVTGCSPNVVAAYVDLLSCTDSCETIVLSSAQSSSPSKYCCYGPGQPNNCSLQTVCGDGTLSEYNDLASCTASCPINVSSSAKSSSSFDPTMYCCISGGCTAYIPCVGVGANCMTTGCCSGSFCDTNGTCTAGTPE